MNRPIANVDLDGCVYDFGGDIRNFVSMRTGQPVEEVIVPTWGTKDGQFDRFWRMGVEEGYVWGIKSSEPLEGARDALWALSDAEWHIRLVTLRLVQSWNHALIVKNTVEWLDMHNIPYRSLSFIGPGEKKSDFKAEAAIDDRPLHVGEYVSVGMEKAFLLPQPWNENAREGLNIATWEGFVDALI